MLGPHRRQREAVHEAAFFQLVLLAVPGRDRQGGLADAVETTLGAERTFNTGPACRSATTR